MRKYLEALVATKQQIQINFAAANQGKLISISGVLSQVGENYVELKDIYNNTLFVPTASIAYVEIKK